MKIDSAVEDALIEELESLPRLDARDRLDNQSLGSISESLRALTKEIDSTIETLRRSSLNLDESKAAMRIQSLFRGYQVRKQLPGDPREGSRRVRESLDQLYASHDGLLPEVDEAEQQSPRNVKDYGGLHFGGSFWSASQDSRFNLLEEPAAHGVDLDESTAAIRIQASFRGYQARKRLGKNKEESRRAVSSLDQLRCSPGRSLSEIDERVSLEGGKMQGQHSSVGLQDKGHVGLDENTGSFNGELCSPELDMSKEGGNVIDPHNMAKAIGLNDIDSGVTNVKCDSEISMPPKLGRTSSSGSRSLGGKNPSYGDDDLTTVNPKGIQPDEANSLPEGSVNPEHELLRRDSYENSEEMRNAADSNLYSDEKEHFVESYEDVTHDQEQGLLLGESSSFNILDGFEEEGVDWQSENDDEPDPETMDVVTGQHTFVEKLEELQKARQVMGSDAFLPGDLELSSYYSLDDGYDTIKDGEPEQAPESETSSSFGLKPGSSLSSVLKQSTNTLGVIAKDSLKSSQVSLGSRLLRKSTASSRAASQIQSEENRRSRFEDSKQSQGSIGKGSQSFRNLNADADGLLKPKSALGEEAVQVRRSHVSFLEPCEVSQDDQPENVQDKDSSLTQLRQSTQVDQEEAARPYLRPHTAPTSSSIAGQS
ncbi:hypothetical protein HDU96_001052, partial [Phlyctochytrium bullatum]